MKLKKLFKKASKSTANKASAQPLNKNQLEKVVGGAEESTGGGSRWQQSGIGHTIVIS